MLKKLLKMIGIYPSEVISFSSPYNKVLEIHKVNEKYLLDSEKANYSYGSLQKAFEFSFQQIDFQNFKPNKILMLGLGAGSILESLPNYLKNTYYSIDAVEIDPLVIELGYKYFDIQRFNNLNIFIMDAKDFIMQSVDSYDFVIIDLFVDLVMPDFLFEPTILQKLKEMTTEKGAILFNTIPNVQDNSAIIYEMSKNGKMIILERYKQINEMIYWQNIK